MNDTIYRQEALDTFKICGLGMTSRGNGKSESISVVSKIINDYADIVRKRIDALQSAQQWIPCSERLPDTNGVYNVTRKISDGFECRNIPDTCYYDGTNTWHDDTRVNHERRYLTDVIAWMPLPEPYTERWEE